MVMPAAKGLFHRAAVGSGATLRTGSPDAAAKIAAALLDELNLSRSQLEKIQTVPAAALVTAQAAVLRRMAGSGGLGGGGGWGPVFDGKVIPAHPFDPSAPAVSQNVPLLIGTCLNEFVNGVDNPEVDSLTSEVLLKRVTESHGDHAKSIIAAYRREYPKESAFGYGLRFPRRGCGRARRLRRNGRPRKVGRRPISTSTPGVRPCWITGQALSTAARLLSCSITPICALGIREAELMRSGSRQAWEKRGPVCCTGKPGHHGLPDWPAYTPEKRATMIFDSTCAVKNDPEGEGLRLMRQSGTPRPA